MKNRKILYKTMQVFILVASMMSNISCEEEVCETCYKIGPNGRTSGKGEEICGEASIRRLEYQGYVCR
jgi:hypothetical protein